MSRAIQGIVLAAQSDCPLRRGLLAGARTTVLSSVYTHFPVLGQDRLLGSTATRAMMFCAFFLEGPLHFQHKQSVFHGPVQHQRRASRVLGHIRPAV